MKQQNKIRYIYKITLLCGSLKDHYYIGQHTTNNIDDNYAGSGCKVSAYYKKYGKIEGETYIKEIIKYCNTLDELNEAEFQEIGDKYDLDPLCLNLAAGGKVCTPSQETRLKISKKLKYQTRSEEQRKHISEAAKIRSNKYPNLIINMAKHSWDHPTSERIEAARQRIIKYNKSEEHKQRVIEYNKSRILSPETHERMRNAQLGRKLSEETKQKLSEISKNTIWINNGEKCKRILGNEINLYIESGWVKGRIVKH